MLDIQFELSIECSEKSSSDWEQSSQFHSVWVLIGLEVSPTALLLRNILDIPDNFGITLGKVWENFEKTLG